ncbi:hypothetical protein L3Q82_016526, partial [Scortum barcoo]
MMTSLKTWYLLFLAALLLLPIVPTVAEVVKVVSDCDQFLLDETPPQVPCILEGGNILNQNRYKPICQTFENVRKFVTLYDIKNRIPVFSAYKYRGDSGEKRPKNTWKIEPQLENEDDKNMMIGEKYKNYINQAGNADYHLNRRFDRGHLIPSSYMFTKKESTFALTNVVPQAKTFNQGSWNRMETCIKCVMNNYCFNNNGVIEGFVVTGAQPSTNNTLKNRINIPSILWSAFCCYSYKMEMWIASAHWSDNVPDGSETKYLQAKTLAELHQELKIVVFTGKQCPRNETVTELYSKNKNLVIKNVDFHCKQNNAEHRTIEITTKYLIVRRGQPFLLTLEMMKPFQDCDLLSLTVETGSAPSEVLGTRCEFGNPSPMYSSNVKAIWKYSIDRRANLQRGIVTLSVTPPANAPVGKYLLSASTLRGKTPLGTLVVLFNPWCPDDWVYLPDERERQEYVMNEDGLIYRGTSIYIQPMDWVFGQFEEDMVDICLMLLDVNPRHLRDPAGDVSARCNPIYVGRVVSAMINCNDDRGVLMGRWHDDYNDGVRPTSWTGSISILRRWYQQNCQPVKYGQCWVFAGVMCTVMRFLGIPCRVVTNFKSAHDTNNNLTIEEYYDEHGLQTKESTESIWNFHVWVEGWMKRPDLNKGTSYDGWQVLDATPQEKSEGQYNFVLINALCLSQMNNCRPDYTVLQTGCSAVVQLPVSAILQGEVNLKYDVPFVFSEVNADVVQWMVSANGVKRKMHSDTMTVGQNISTKAVGNNMRNDITNTYKYREDVILPIEIPFLSYSKFMVGCDSMKVSVMAFDKQQQDEIYHTEIDIALEDPPISIKVLSEARLYHSMTIEVKFTNPLNETLRYCSLNITGCGLFKSDYIV